MDSNRDIGINRRVNKALWALWHSPDDASAMGLAAAEVASLRDANVLELPGASSRQRAIKRAIGAIERAVGHARSQTPHTWQVTSLEEGAIISEGWAATQPSARFVSQALGGWAPRLDWKSWTLCHPRWMVLGAHLTPDPSGPGRWSSFNEHVHGMGIVSGEALVEVDPGTDPRR